MLAREQRINVDISHDEQNVSVTDALYGVLKPLFMELVEDINLVKGTEEHLFMVANKDPNFARFAPFASSAHNRRAVRPAINEIAQQNDVRIGWIARGIVRFDLSDQRSKQIHPAMNVADNVVARAVGNARQSARLGFSAKQIIK